LGFVKTTSLPELDISYLESPLNAAFDSVQDFAFRG
jgi:hypothetical protein